MKTVLSEFLVVEHKPCSSEFVIITILQEGEPYIIVSKLLCKQSSNYIYSATSQWFSTVSDSHTSKRAMEFEVFKE
jgi:hypothetical protein